MEDKNLQEQYALLEEERKEDKRKTIILIIIFILIILFILLGLYFAYSRPKKTCLLNCDINGDGFIDTNIDADGDGFCDVNCQVDGSDNKKYLINIDYNNDEIPHFNIDAVGNDNIPDTNLVNKDIDGDSIPDLNIDVDGDRRPDINIDLDNTKICSLNCDVTGDNVPDVNIDTNKDNKADLNIDVNGDGVADFNIDTNEDNVPDKNLINQNTDSDSDCDLNCDTNGDGKPDTDIDVNGDGVCDENCVSLLKSNANIESLKIGNYVLSPAFKENVTEYTVKVDDDLTDISISAETVNPNAKVTGTGTVKLNGSSTRVSIVVIAEDGTVKTYYVTINKSEDVSVEENGDSDFEINTTENNSLMVSYTKDINVEDIIPGWNGTQTFTLKNKSKKTIVYNVNLLDVVNTFKSDNLKYSLIKDDKVIVEQTPALRSDGAIYEKLIIAPGETANFELNFEFLETNQVQNEDYDVKYSSKVEIKIVSVK